MFDGRFVGSTTKKSMMILGNAMTVQSLTEKCSNAEHSIHFLHLMDYLNDLYSNPTSNVIMRAACYHQGEPNNSSAPTFFPFHLDKAFAQTVWFVPLSDYLFFTIVAIPSHWYDTQDAQSSALFNKWISSLSCEDKHSVEVFMKAMKSHATTTIKETKLLVYACNVGSFLGFPASLFLHGTIIPGLTTRNQSRDLLIIHPLEIVSSGLI